MSPPCAAATALLNVAGVTVIVAAATGGTISRQAAAAAPRAFFNMALIIFPTLFLAAGTGCFIPKHQYLAAVAISLRQHHRRYRAGVNIMIKCKFCFTGPLFLSLDNAAARCYQQPMIIRRLIRP